MSTTVPITRTIDISRPKRPFPIDLAFALGPEEIPGAEAVMVRLPKNARRIFLCCWCTPEETEDTDLVVLVWRMSGAARGQVEAPTDPQDEVNAIALTEAAGWIEVELPDAVQTIVALAFTPSTLSITIPSNQTPSDRCH